MPDSGPQPGSAQGQNIPRPDPSDRTTLGLYREIEHLRELLEGQIQATNARIEAEKELTNALFRASTENVATAFTAAKEAVSKQEADTTKQLDRLRDMIAVGEASVAQRFEDLKGRLDRGEGKSSGVNSAAGAILAIAGVLIAVAGLAFSVFLNR